MIELPTSRLFLRAAPIRRSRNGSWFRVVGRRGRLVTSPRIEVLQVEALIRNRSVLYGNQEVSDADF